MIFRPWYPDLFFARLTTQVLEMWLPRAPDVLVRLDGLGPLGEQVRRAWSTVPDEDRRRLEEDLLPIHDMCVPDAKAELEALAHATWVGDAARYGWSQEELALRLFLADRNRFVHVWEDHEMRALKHVGRFGARYSIEPVEDADRIERLKSAVRLTLRLRNPARDRVVVDAAPELFTMTVHRYDEAHGRVVLSAVLVFFYGAARLIVKTADALTGEYLRELFGAIVAGDGAFFEAAAKGASPDAPRLVRSSDVYATMAARNGLERLDAVLPEPFAPLGILHRRGLIVPAVWTRDTFPGFDAVCRGLRATLGGDGLIVLMGTNPQVSFAPAERIAVIELLESAEGNLGLSRGLDILDPTYRARAALRDSSHLDVDFLHVNLATQKDRHLFSVNEHELLAGGPSDAVFAPILLLAAYRKFGPNGGWCNKAVLVGDFAAKPDPRNVVKADRLLTSLRFEFREGTVAGISADELDAMIKTDRGTGCLRLGVPGENIAFGASLATLTWKLGATVAQRAALNASQRDGLARANLLVREARRLGVPGPIDDPSLTG